MNKPPYLQAGNTIAITATARKVSLEELQPSIDLFTSWGLNVQLAEGIFEADYQFAGTDAVRARALQLLLDNPNVQAIICARGGYGTVRIVDQLDFAAFALHPKWIIGFSDVTVLHSHIFSHCNIPTLHAAMPITMQAHNSDAESNESLRKALFGEGISYAFRSHPLNKTGTAKGTLIGGNLSVLYALLGSPSDIDTTDCVLFLEDLDEYLYHIDRMMVNLKRAGKLKNLAGILIGGMSDMRDNTIPFGKTAVEIIAEHVAEFNYPVAFGFPAGHDRKNLAMVFGTTCSLRVEGSQSLLTQ